jgi:hypothetical protein
LATLIGVEKIEWQAFEPLVFPCTCCDERRGTLFAKVVDRDIVIKVAVCGQCLHRLGASGISAVVMGGGDSS